MEYFHLGIFVIPRVYLISKNWSQTQAFFFVFHKFFHTVACIFKLSMCSNIYGALCSYLKKKYSLLFADVLVVNCTNALLNLCFP